MNVICVCAEDIARPATQCNLGISRVPRPTKLRLLPQAHGSASSWHDGFAGTAAGRRDAARVPSRPGFNDLLDWCIRGVAQPGRAPGSGPGGRRFESSRPDHVRCTLRATTATMVCVKKDQATEDREAVVASLRDALGNVDKSLVGNKGRRNFLRARGKQFAVDEVDEDAAGHGDSGVAARSSKHAVSPCGEKVVDIRSS